MPEDAEDAEGATSTADEVVTEAASTVDEVVAEVEATADEGDRVHGG